MHNVAGAIHTAKGV